MAQWDQRDPRWLVSELGATGSNVNGWHWEEKSKMAWCKERLSALTSEVRVELDPALGAARLAGLEDVTGEAYLTRRKGNKSLAVYDLSITLAWLGSLAEEEAEVGGTVKISEFALGNDEDDYILTVTADKEEEKYKCLVDAVRAARPKLLELLSRLDAELKALTQ